MKAQRRGREGKAGCRDAEGGVVTWSPIRFADMDEDLSQDVDQCSRRFGDCEFSEALLSGGAH